MKVLYLLTGSLVLFTGLLTVPVAPAQSASPAAPSDYSFTISTAQPWTDTGLDLQAGAVLQIKASVGQNCDPAGISGTASTDLPEMSAPAGSLIGKLQATGAPIRVGADKQLTVEKSGHLFLGVNSSGTSPCNGSFAVKVHLTPGPPVSSSSSTASPAAASPGEAPRTAPAQDIKSKLSSAAQVFLAGQFGTGATASTSSAATAPAGNDVVAPTSATNPPPAAPVNLKVSPGSLDLTLQKDIDGLPRRVNDEFNNQGDMVNFVLVGSEQQVKDALDAASWRVADIDSREAILKAVLDTYQKRDYLQMPMSQLYLFGRKQDFGYELAQAYSVVASRHHFRIWKAPATWNGKPMWAGAGTHDIGFEKDQRNGKVTHKIDPAVDGERDNIGQTLQTSGKVKSMYYYLPPDPVQGAKNATGGGYHSDGRILVVELL
jgi:hypothetical protein